MSGTSGMPLTSPIRAAPDLEHLWSRIGTIVVGIELWHVEFDPVGEACAVHSRDRLWLAHDRPNRIRGPGSRSELRIAENTNPRTDFKLHAEMLSQADEPDCSF